MTITLVFGSYGGFHLRYTKNRAIGFCLGWVAFTIYWYDQEDALTKYVDVQKNRKQISKKEPAMRITFSAN